MFAEMTRATALARRVGVALCFSACGDDTGDESAGNPTGVVDVPDAEVRYATKYLDIAPLFDAPICGGTLAMLDEHVGYVARTLDVEVDGHVPVYVREYGSPGPGGWCGGASGCHKSGVILTILSAAPHELVHAVTIGARGSSFWNEHVAHAFEGDYTYYLSPFEKGVEWDSGVWTNGHIVRWLIDWGGGPTFMDLFDATEPGASQAEVEAAFRGVYGLELSAALSEYAAAAPYVYPDNLQCYVPDGVVDVPWDDRWWEHEVSFDCASASTFTANDEISRMSARIPFSIAAPGKYRFDAEHLEAEILIHRCIDAPSAEPVEDLSRWPQVSNPVLGAPTLPVGRYVLEVSVPLGDPLTVRVQGYPSIEPQEVP